MRNQVILAEAMLSDQEQDHYTVRKGKETLVGYVFLQSLLSKDLKDTQAHGPKRILQVRKWDIFTFKKTNEEKKKTFKAQMPALTKS